MAAVTNRAVATTGNGIGPRTIIASIIGAGSDVSQAELDGTLQALTVQSAAGGGVSAADAFTIAGVSGTVASGTMYVALQGSGTLGTDAGDYYTGVTVAAVATFG